MSGSRGFSGLMETRKHLPLATPDPGQATRPKPKPRNQDQEEDNPRPHLTCKAACKIFYQKFTNVYGKFLFC